MSKPIKFDISCFKEEFQKFIFENLNIQNYYEFINIYKNQFELNIQCINCSDNIQDILPINLLSVEEECSFNSIKQTENTQDYNKSEDEDTDENITDDTDENNYLDQNFSYTIEESNIILKSDKKFINKKIAKKLKKNGGKWNKKTNEWHFPLSKKHYIDNFILKKNDNLIQEIKQENNRVIIIPTSNHPKFGTSIIYDKSDNIGIWDNSIKGWVFDKKI